MSDFNWNELAAGVLEGIASGLDGGDPDAITQTGTPPPVAGDITRHLPLIAIAGVGLIGVALLLRK